MDKDLVLEELSYRTSRASGPGGQNVNKVESKVEAVFDIATSNALSSAEKATLLEKLTSRLSMGSVLSVVHQTERSQLANKKQAQKRILTLLETALIPVVKRKPNVVPFFVKVIKRKNKVFQSNTKAQRRKPNLDDFEE